MLNALLCQYEASIEWGNLSQSQTWKKSLQCLVFPYLLMISLSIYRWLGEIPHPSAKQRGETPSDRATDIWSEWVNEKDFVEEDLKYVLVWKKDSKLVFQSFNFSFRLMKKWIQNTLSPSWYKTPPMSPLTDSEFPIRARQETFFQEKKPHTKDPQIKESSNQNPWKRKRLFGEPTSRESNPSRFAALDPLNFLENFHLLATWGRCYFAWGGHGTCL